MRSSPTAIALKAMAPDGTGPRLWSCCGSRPGGAPPAGGISLTGVRPLFAGERAPYSRSERGFRSLQPMRDIPKAIVASHDLDQTLFRAISWRAMMMRCNSLVPSPITSKGASR